MMQRSRVLLVVFGSLSLLLLYLPLLLVVVFSFNSAPRGMVWESFSTRWYQSVWSDAAIMSSLKNTAAVVLGTGVVSLAGGLVSGFAIGTSREKAFSLSLPFLFMPVILPDLVVALAQALLYKLLGLQQGILTIVLSQATFGVAYVALFVIVRIKSVPYNGYVIAAQTLGASPVRVLFDHFLPTALPAAIAGVTVVIAMSAQDFIYAFFCGGPASTTLSIRVYSMVKFGVNSSVNVVYVFLAGIALLSYWLSESVLTKQRLKQ
jgi:ABC-type spermidine/putrescine transport system permease subunit II